MFKEVLFVSLCLVSCRGGAKIEPGRFAPLHTLADQIVDAEGRQVILRGVQHHALQDVRYKGREVLPEDYARIASYGFTTMRVAISWSRIEPTRGNYDAAAIAEIVDVLDRAHAVGLTVIVEWHQDLWGKCTQAESSPQYMNANGAPDWACSGGPTGALVHLREFDRFYRNEDGLRDAFIAAWSRVIADVKDHPALIGYDILNEPAGSGGSPAFERDTLFPFYRKVVPALRAAGAQGLLFIDAPVNRNESLEMYAESLLDLGEDVVFAPHLYTSWVTVYILKSSPGAEDKRRDFDNAQMQASTMGLPWWNGEWGVNLLAESGIRDLEAHVSLEDEFMVGSSYWAFERATPNQGDDSISGGQSLLNSDGSPREDALRLLARSYPIQIPGTLRKLKYSFLAGRLTFEVDASNAAAPLVLYTERDCFDVTGGEEWDYSFDAKSKRLLIQFRAQKRFVVTTCQ